MSEDSDDVDGIDEMGRLEQEASIVETPDEDPRESNESADGDED